MKKGTAANDLQFSLDIPKVSERESREKMNFSKTVPFHDAISLEIRREAKQRVLKSAIFEAPKSSKKT